MDWRGRRDNRKGRPRRHLTESDGRDMTPPEERPLPRRQLSLTGRPPIRHRRSNEGEKLIPT